MQRIRRILVVLNPEQSDGLALRRAKHIANAIHADLHLLFCDHRHDHAPFIGELSEELAGEGFRVTAQQVSCDHLHPTDAILAERQASDCDLVIKQHYPDNPLTKSLLTPEDWKLLRHCPVPVLLVKTKRPWTGGLVLAAMDVDNPEDVHRELQANIIVHAVDLAELIQGSVHAACAYPQTFFSSADSSSPKLDGNAAHCLEACSWFQNEYELHDHQLHILEGPAKAVIAQIAHELEAVVTVIGTVARSGLSGMLIGNTAEALLDRVESDVLVLKPRDSDVHLLEPYEEHLQEPPPNP